MADERVWSKSDVKRLKEGLAKAQKEKKEVFNFDGNDVLVDHVVVLLQILQRRFKL